MSDNIEELPALPPMPLPSHPTHSLGPLWSQEQMHEYAFEYARPVWNTAVERIAKMLENPLSDSSIASIRALKL